jgi:hypothetical protein
VRSDDVSHLDIGNVIRKLRETALLPVKRTGRLPLAPRLRDGAHDTHQGADERVGVAVIDMEDGPVQDGLLDQLRVESISAPPTGPSPAAPESDEAGAIARFHPRVRPPCDTPDLPTSP